MHRWLFRQLLRSVKDAVFAAVTAFIALVLLGVGLWYNIDLTAILNFNLGAVHSVMSLLPVIGRRLEFLLRIAGIDHILFFAELWAFVALLLRAVGLCFRALRKRALKSWTQTEEVEGEVIMTDTTQVRAAPMQLKPAGMGWGKFFALVALFLLFVAYVAATLFGSDELVGKLAPKMGLFNVTVDPLIIAAAITFWAYRVQVALSGARGGKRILESFASFLMLGIVALAFAVWIKFPILEPVLSWLTSKIGLPIATDPSDYKVSFAIVFGVPAFWDFIGRDVLGIGRRPRTVRGSAEILPPDSEAHDASMRQRVILEPEAYLRHPITGELVRITHLPPQLANRMVEHLAPPDSPAT